MFEMRNHPFPVEAFFKKSIVLTYAVDINELAPLVPAPFTIDSYQEKWGFVAVAIVNTTVLRPKSFPKFLGKDFILIGFRIFVRYRSNSGRSLRGLYILRSETDKNSMTILGNIFTHYRYVKTDIIFREDGKTFDVLSRKSHITIQGSYISGDGLLPEGSPFTDWKSARRFSGPLPHTFTLIKNNRVLIVEGKRTNWTPEPIHIDSANIGFIESLNFKKIILASGFAIENIPYQWKKGVIETFKS